MRFVKLRVGDPRTGDKDLEKALKVAHQYFIKGISKAALITIDDKVYKLFGASPSHYWKNNRNGVPAKMLAGLLV